MEEKKIDATTEAEELKEVCSTTKEKESTEEGLKIWMPYEEWQVADSAYMEICELIPKAIEMSGNIEAYLIKAVLHRIDTLISTIGVCFGD